MSVLIIFLIIQIINISNSSKEINSKIERIEDKDKILSKEDYNEIKEILEKKFSIITH